MSDHSHITTGLSAETSTAIAATSEDVFDTIDEVIAHFPELTEADAAGDLARLATHFAHGDAFKVINDPQTFEAAYRARVKTEDPSQPWQQGVSRLIDFGLPDFADVIAPQLAGSELTWTVEDSFTGLPYRAVISLDKLEDVVLTVLPMNAIAQDFPLREKETIIEFADDAEG